MQQYVTMILTAVVTITTIIYTFYSVRLWRTSRQSAEISRQAALASLWSELNRYIEICKLENRPEAPVLGELSGIFAEYMIASLLSGVNTESDPNIKVFKNNIQQMVDSTDFDASTIRWLSPLIKQKAKPL